MPEVLRTGRERSLMVCLAWHVHRRLHIREVQNVRKEILSTDGDVIILGPDGEPLGNPGQRPAEGERITDPDVRRNGLTDAPVPA
ncbi:hypothetical protein AB0368_30320 [Actinoplanes sp. NPDC051475]|uniref:hypothetical protein n=1 Tax=Actinoplanes sp. NPDC051475 TaxID=3157225 RepID=UPI00344B3854